MKKHRQIIWSVLLVVVLVATIGGVLSWRWLQKDGISSSWIYCNRIHTEQLRQLSSDDPDFQYGHLMIAFSADRQAKPPSKASTRVTLDIPLDENCGCLYSAIFPDTDYFVIYTSIFVPNSDRKLVPHQSDGTIDWEAIAFDPQLAKKYSRITGIQAEG